MTVKIEHSENGNQLATYLITQSNGDKYLAYEGDADYEAIQYLLKELAESQASKEIIRSDLRLYTAAVLSCIDSSTTINIGVRFKELQAKHSPTAKQGK